MHGTGGTGAQFARPRLRRRAVRPGPAARRDAVLHHPARRHRPRQVEQAERRPAREVPALRLPGHGRGGVRAAHRGLGVNHLRLVMGTSMGGHAHLAVGRALSGLHGRADAARLPARQISGRNRVWRRVVIDAIRNDPEWKGGELHDPAAERADRGGDAVAGRQQPGAAPARLPTLAQTDEVLDAFVANWLRTATPTICSTRSTPRATTTRARASRRSRRRCSRSTPPTTSSTRRSSASSSGRSRACPKGRAIVIPLSDRPPATAPTPSRRSGSSTWSSC